MASRKTMKSLAKWACIEENRVALDGHYRCALSRPLYMQIMNIMHVGTVRQSSVMDERRMCSRALLRPWNSESAGFLADFCSVSKWESK